MASPILPCGCLCSIPIPYGSGVPYSEVQFGKRTLWSICRELDPNWGHRLAHVDPDLRYESLARDKRARGWRPAFGQISAAASHLNNQHVDKGDLFLFFGWFRRTKYAGGKLEFDSTDAGRHIIYGWLEVGQIVEVDNAKQALSNDLLFVRSHPHFHFSEHKYPNKVYVSSLSGLKAGLFGIESKHLVLTEPGSRVRSQWLLPKKPFESVFRDCGISYHGNATRWKCADAGISLKVVNRGQEFVLDGERQPSVYGYFAKVIKDSMRSSRTCHHDY
jgi:hypothetical protein